MILGTVIRLYSQFHIRRCKLDIQRKLLVQRQNWSTLWGLRCISLSFNSKATTYSAPSMHKALTLQGIAKDHEIFYPKHVDQMPFRALWPPTTFFLSDFCCKKGENCKKYFGSNTRLTSHLLLVIYTQKPFHVGYSNLWLLPLSAMQPHMGSWVTI